MNGNSLVKPLQLYGHRQPKSEYFLLDMRLLDCLFSFFYLLGSHEKNFKDVIRPIASQANKIR